MHVVRWRPCLPNGGRMSATRKPEENGMRCEPLFYASLLAANLLAGFPASGAASPISSAALRDAADAIGVDTVVVRRGGAAVRRTGVAVGPRGGVAVRRTGVAVGPRGGVAVGRTAVARPGYYGRWARPAGYWWRPGTAVAAGAAIGFVSAATAVAWAGAAPAPGMCWYYTDATRTQGFWDACP